MGTEQKVFSASFLSAIRRMSPLNPGRQGRREKHTQTVHAQTPWNQPRWSITLPALLSLSHSAVSIWPTHPEPNFTPPYPSTHTHFPFILPSPPAVTCSPFQPRPCCLNSPCSQPLWTRHVFHQTWKHHRASQLSETDSLPCISIYLATSCQAKLRSEEWTAARWQCHLVFFFFIIIPCSHWINVSKNTSQINGS